MSINTKKIADLITFIRTLLMPLFIWLGFAEGSQALPLVVVLILTNWTLDSLDGPLARRHKAVNSTWIGQHDLEIDLLITTSVLIYLTVAGLGSWPVTLGYMAVWLLVFWLMGIRQILGILYQLPIYLWLFIVLLIQMPQLLLLLIVWAVLAMIATWPKVPKVIVPDLISGISDLFNRPRRSL